MGLRRLLLDLLGVRPERLQVAALCLRAHEDRREVLLITSKRQGRWILPKGWPMAGSDLPGSAQQEAWEEAGARGRVHPQPLGRYHYDSVLVEDFAQPVEVVVFQMDEVELADDYPEVGQRERRWWPLQQAAAQVDEPELAQILRSLDKPAQ
ncbi:NUDIX hydrolase [Lysobacteraceae bacterium NML75-0749]|nr:NUDIX hydrolase [Xanthomonadaceae bacterium NML75-0749]PJK06009.1 NUDIX hydrolase [Xanthomonadaceae bacterium NML91-0268]